MTVSLDALDDDVLRQVTDAPVSARRILAGIEAAQAAGLAPVKVNMVVRRGLNDDCVLAMAERFRGSGATLRLIEYMDVGTTNGWTPEQVVPASELLARIGARWPLEPLPPRHAGEVASRFRYADGAGELGVIHSVSSPFCGSCTRARLSAEGRLYTCLFASEGADLRALLRGGATDAQIEQRLRAVWGARADRYSALRASAPAPAPGELDQREQARIEMSYIGG